VSITDYPNEILDGRRWRNVLHTTIDMERESTGGIGPFERQWLLERKQTREGLRRQLEAAKNGTARMITRWENPELAGRFVPVITGGASSPFASVVGQPSANPTSHTAVNTTTSETNLWVPGIWTPIPANDMVTGKVYKIEAGGIFSTSSAAPTSTWTPRCGQSATPSSNVTLGATTGSTMIASLNNVPWYWTFTLAIRALGLAASGCSGTGNGAVIIGGLTTAVGVVQSMGATVASTLDNTAATGLILSQTWQTSQAANNVQAQFTTPVYSLN
jgi:hypothetical protein